MKLTKMRQSNDVLEDPTALRARMKTDGYIFLRGVLEKEKLSGTEAAVAKILQRNGWIDEADDSPRKANMASACSDMEVEFRKVYGEVFSLREFHRVPHDPRLLQVMGYLLDSDQPVIHPRKVGRLVFPVSRKAGDFTTPSHQDARIVQGAPETYTIWIPFHDCSIMDGGLSLVPKSHTAGVLPIKLALGAGGTEVHQPFDGQWCSADYERGDVVIFTGLTVHKALPNRSSNIRMSMDCRCQRANEPVNVGSVQLIGDSWDWDQIYSNWPDEEDELKYYWAKTLDNTVPFDTSYYEERDQLALTEGAKGNELAISGLHRLIRFSSSDEKRDSARAILQKFEWPTGI